MLLQAYCTIDGLLVDVLINGVAAQNRAVCSFSVSAEIYVILHALSVVCVFLLSVDDPTVQLKNY